MADVSAEKSDSHCSLCDFEVLEALYQLNVEAKKYAESADDAYRNGFKASARQHSLRKKALYGLKEGILETLVEHGCIDTVRCHEIDEREYYCFYVGEFSFHSPVSEWDEPPLDASPSSATELDSFNSGADNRTDHVTEREALERLSETFETPNNYLPTPFVEGNHSSQFAGWSWLPGAIEEGDRVDGRFGREIKNPFDEFLFAVGDTFQTRKGECEILDRYQAWLTTWIDRSPILPRTVYDVKIGGEVRETIRQRRIVDDWSILVDSIHDPVPNVKGKQAEIVGDDIQKLVESPVEFDVGDIIELEPMRDIGDAQYCKITEASLSYSLIMCTFEPVPPSKNAPLGLSVSEFADDVVAVHDEPPSTD